MAVEPFFLPAGSGQRFCLYHPPRRSRPDGATVLFVHAFAEEMNKSRRMAALQARALAAAGHGVLQLDLLGCGDSSGDFGDADWQSWLEDLALGARWLRERQGGALWLWGHRAGCLLATAAAPAIGDVAGFLFWHPVASGRQCLQQFLRLKVAGDMLAGEGKGLMEGLRRRLDQGESVEIAGYRLSPGLARGLEAAELAPPAGTTRLEWLEVSPRPDAELAPVARKRLDDWAAAGHRVRGRVVMGPQFWQTVEIEDCPALIEATGAALEGAP